MYEALECFRESGRQRDLICGLVVPQGKVKSLFREDCVRCEVHECRVNQNNK